MNNSKLIRLLKTFSLEREKKFIDFLQSPYIERVQKNTMQRRVKLTRYIFKHIKTPNSAHLQKEKVWRIIYPKSIYRPGHMAQAMSKLLEKAQEFVALEGFRNDDIQIQLNILDYYTESTFPKSDLDRIFNNANRLLQKDVHKNDDWIYNLFLLERAKANYEKKAKHIRGTMRYLDLHYFFKKIEYACLFSNDPELYKDKLLLLEETQEILANNEEIQRTIPTIELYILAYRMLQNQAINEDFDRYIDLLLQFIDCFEAVALKALYLYAINTLARKINLNENEKQTLQYRFQYFRIYKEVVITHKLIYVNGKITVSEIRNFIRNVFSLDEQVMSLEQKIKEARHFLEFHKDKIEAEEADPQHIYAANKAMIDFHQKQYDQCLHKLEQSELSLLPYLLDQKRMKIKCYYELDKFEDLDKTTNAFEKGLRTKKMKGQAISEKNQAKNLNFLKFLNKIKHSTTFKNSARIHKIATDIQETKLLQEKGWLLEKLMEQK